jgi:hypothetical protein
VSCYGECHSVISYNAELILRIVVLLIVTVLSDTQMSVNVLNVTMLCAALISAILLNAIMPSVTLLCVILLNEVAQRGHQRKYVKESENIWILHFSSLVRSP